VSNLYEDHVAAFLALLSGTGLTAYDSIVSDGAPETYVLVYPHFETPDGTIAPDALSLVLSSIALDAWMYVHSVSSTPASARAIAARARTAVLDQVLTVAGRACFPVRWREGQPVRRDEEIPGGPVFDQVDVYGWRSVPA
jgi:hypothetical protein